MSSVQVMLELHGHPLDCRTATTLLDAGDFDRLDIIFHGFGIDCTRLTLELS